MRLPCRIGICEVRSCPLPCIPSNVRIGIRGTCGEHRRSQTSSLARGLRSWNRCYCSRFRWANPFPLGSSVLRCSVSHEGCKPYCLSVFPMSALPKPRILLPLLFPYPFCFWFFVFNADSRAEGVEFQTILSASRLSDIFFNASFCRIGRFRFGCLKR